jgi:tungstate transport system substrate-binding protein
MRGAFGRRDILKLALAIFALFILATSISRAADDFIIVQSTTSTQNSGLFEHILPIFTKKTGIEVRVVAVGTGQALKNAEKGDGDVVLVHSQPDEEKFVADGWGVKRYPVMYNDFIIVGPRSRQNRGDETSARCLLLRRSLSLPLVPMIREPTKRN